MSSNTSSSSSERRDAAENRQRILETAQKLFDRYGVEQVSMNQIAREAGVGPGTLYRRYRNKSELCFDLIKDNFIAFLKDVAYYLDQNQAIPPNQRLREIIRLFIDFRERKLQLFAGVEESLPTHSHNFLPSDNLFNELHQHFIDLFNEINKAEHTHFNSVFKADMLINALGGEAYSFQREVRSYSPDDILEQICKTFL